MAIRRILRGDESALHKACRPVEKINKRTLELLDDMAETMYKAEGVGLAANQVGILRRVVVIDAGEGLIELINPEVVYTEGEEGAMEACLSYPGESGYVVRPSKVRVRAMDRDGAWQEYEGEGLLARAFLHETDHLDGRVYVDLVTEAPEEFLRQLEEEKNSEAEEEEGE